MDEIQDLFVSGRHGYHTFRIPALAVSTAGTVLAFAEGRRHDRADTGDIDTVLRRRERGAPEFDALRVVVAGGGDVAGNPAPVVDRDSGRITLLFCRNPHDGPEDLVWQDKAERTVWLTHSDDDGKTWASPREITSAVKRPGWTWYATGPCHGVQLRSGRLVIPCDHGVGRQYQRYVDSCRSHLLLSDDGGITWRIGAATGDGTNECVVVELDDGSLYLNRRCDRRDDQPLTAGASRAAWTAASRSPRTAGMTTSWTPTARPRPFARAAPARRSCLRMPPAKRGSGSPCGAATTVDAPGPTGLVVHPGPAAYSDLCALGDGTVGLLYESGDAGTYERLRWTRLSVDDLGG